MEQPPVRRDVFLEKSPPVQVAKHVSAWVFLLLIVGSLALLQQLAQQKRTDRSDNAGPQLVAGGRYALGAANFSEELPFSGVSGELLLQQLRDQAKTPYQQLMITPVVAELANVQAALNHLERLALAPRYQDLADVLARLYRGETLSDQERTSLQSEMGWFGELALSYGASPEDLQRQAVLDQAKRTFFAMALVSAAAVAGLVLGVVVLILMIIGLQSGRLHAAYRRRFPGRQPGRIQHLEVMSMFLIAFVVFSSFTALLPAALSWLGLSMSLVALVWLRLRGLSTDQIRADIGLHGGVGWIRETGAGVIGYLAGLPILGVGFGITILLTQLTGAEPMHPVADQFENASTMDLLMIFVLACVVAPIVEETFFRGAFYHYLRGIGRGWWAALAAGLISGVIFAAIHPQGFAAVPVLASLGAVFALIREWRDSLIGAIIAHGLNNFVVLCLSVLMLG